MKVKGVDTLAPRWFWVSATCIRGKVCLLILVTGKRKNKALNKLARCSNFFSI